MSTQRYEIEAWLGDDRNLTGEQIDQLVTVADEIADRYADPDDGEEREASLTVAYRLMTEDEGLVVDELARELVSARLAQVRALAGLRQAAVSLIPAGRETQAGFARRAGVDRMAVRGWLGQR
jgi:hypothetical protein